MRVPLCFILLLLTIRAVIAVPLSPRLNLIDTELSPLKDILVENYREDDHAGAQYPDFRQLWLANPKNSKERVLLFPYQRIAEVYISPDERYLVIDDQAYNRAWHLRVFKREKGLHYCEIKSLHPEMTLWNYAAKRERFKTKWIDDFIYTFLGWSKDSKSIQVALDGGGPVGELKGWIGNYNIESQKVTFDSRESAKYGGGKFQRER